MDHSITHLRDLDAALAAFWGENVPNFCESNIWSLFVRIPAEESTTDHIIVIDTHTCLIAVLKRAASAEFMILSVQLQWEDPRFFNVNFPCDE